MIDGMVAVLHEEQKDDDTQKAFCDQDIAKSEGEKKDTEEAIAASEAFIDETTAESANLAEEIATLQKEIKELDKAVAEATEQRKKELTDEEKILASSGRSDMIATEAPEMIYGTTQTVYAQVFVKKDAPAPPPETR